MLSNEKLKSLSGIKGYLIIILVLFHTIPAYDYRIVHMIKNYGGFFGNYMFFILSGYLSAYSFQSSANISFSAYIHKKLIKLWPFYAFINILQLGVNIYTQGIRELNLSHLLCVLCMQSGGALTDDYPYIVPGWFLCTLMVCYVLFYTLNYISARLSINRLWLYFLALFWGIILELHNWSFPFCYNHDGEGILNFFLGAILFNGYCIFVKQRYLVYSVFIAVIVLLIILPIQIAGDIRMILSFIICPAIIVLSLEQKLIHVILTSRISMFLGSLSMYIFLSHTFSLLLNLHPFGTASLDYLCYLFVLLIVCVIEKKLDKCVRAKFKEPALNK